VRIISPFKDYYDSAAGYDHVVVPVYVRESLVTPLQGSLGYWHGAQSHWTCGDEAVLFAMRHIDSLLVGTQDTGPAVGDATLFAVGFCGMVGVGWRWNSRVYWDALELARAAGADEHHVLAGARIHWPPSNSERASHLPVFRALDTPVFLFEEGPGRFVRNPRLSALQFQRIVDPYSARQAVDTYLGNELAKQVDPSSGIGDEDMRDMKGFDDRSFKAAPGGPTRKRKKKS